MPQEYTFMATAAFGLEGIVAGELRRLGFEAKGYHGGAYFSGSLEDAFFANLWLRTADRVMILFGRFPATSFEELFQGIQKLPFEDILPEDAFCHVTATCARSKLMSPRDTQAIAKKALVERMKKAYSIDWLPESGPKYRIDIHIHQDEVTVAIDTTGQQGLSRRGYRILNAEAPLRESLAAAMVMTSPWRPWLPFYDPLCGSGTLCIEAAMIALDRAPGLERNFAMESWAQGLKSKYEERREEARQLFEKKKAEGPVKIAGTDRDEAVLKLAKVHLEKAGLEGLVSFSQKDIAIAENPFGTDEGTIVTNPPYGERLGDEKEAEEIYRYIRKLHDRLPGWGLSTITSHKGFERVIGKRCDRKRRVYNGRIECEIFNYYPPRKERPAQEQDMDKS